MTALELLELRRVQLGPVDGSFTMTKHQTAAFAEEYAKERMAEIRDHIRTCEMPTLGVSPRLTVVWTTWFHKLKEMLEPAT